MAIRIGLLMSLLAAAAVCGCNRAGYPDTTPVTGTVTYKGEPVEGATVQLTPNSPEGKPANARTDAQGKFKMKTFQDDDGAVPGKYGVTVSKVSHKGEGEGAAGDELPVKYKDPTTSGLTADVPDSGPLDLPLELKD